MATQPAAPDPVWSECGRYWFDERAGEAAVAFFPRYLRFTKGEWAGRPFVLEPWEADDIIRPFFGWKRKDGTRRYRRCIVWVPRKNGKTELAAGVAHLALMGDGEAGAEVYAIAKDKDQASIVFNIAGMMVSWSPELAAHLETYKTAIFCPALNGSFKPLTGVPKGKHGLNANGLIGDEVHEWPDGDLYTFVHQSTAARRQAIEFLISTAGTRIGYGWELWQYCERVLAGEIEDPETLIVVYGASAEDDWTDEATWRKANPNFGVSVKPDYLAAECQKAQSSPRLENDFKRYHLNIWTEQAIRWLPMEAWDACSEAGRWEAFAEQLVGRRCFGGLDLSTTTDLTVLDLLFPPETDGESWKSITIPFVPEERMRERVRRDRVPYDRWVAEGALIATPGNVLDYDYVISRVEWAAEQFKLERLAIDRWNSTQIAIQLNERGIPAYLMGQGFASLSAPSKELERLVLSGTYDHGGHPVARWCAGNVAIATDPAGNIKPAKDKSTERIDVIAAKVNALGAALMEEAPKSYDMIVL